MVITSIREIPSEYQKDFVNACIADLFKVEQSMKVVHSFVTLTGRVTLNENDDLGLIRTLIPETRISDKVFVEAKKKFNGELLDNLTEVEFTVASMDANQGEDKSFGRYHEADNTPINDSQRWIDYKAAALCATASGVIPGSLGTIVGIYPQVAGNIASVNTPLQGLIWGAGAICGYF